MAKQLPSESSSNGVSRYHNASPSDQASARELHRLVTEAAGTRLVNVTVNLTLNDHEMNSSATHAPLKLEEGVSADEAGTARFISVPGTNVISPESATVAILEGLVVALEREKALDGAGTPPLPRARGTASQRRARFSTKKKELHRSWTAAASRLLVGVAMAVIVTTSLRKFALCMNDDVADNVIFNEASDGNLPDISPHVFHFGDFPRFQPRIVPLLPLEDGEENSGTAQGYEKDFLHAESIDDFKKREARFRQRYCSRFAVVSTETAGFSARVPESMVTASPMQNHPETTGFFGIPVTRRSLWRNLVQIKEGSSDPLSVVLDLIILGALLLSLVRYTEADHGTPAVPPSLDSPAVSASPGMKDKQEK
ncbi:hypothetical protein BESB_060220 [Besnoitia besnoiti]|uniref:Uncharacterized protein n=1 Tax=Besnoitia besnoiti TaxID=94643 RepID=A0A2A9MAX6_BESBE|nr:hypothetical protein BESB_060220 [Besnoitia besnoiti]PFH35135.1 hypothetical protein BESB_060220 [Besnoitia besnoiti]